MLNNFRHARILDSELKTSSNVAEWIHGCQFVAPLTEAVGQKRNSKNRIRPWSFGHRTHPYLAWASTVPRNAAVSY
jgi:hypothetical protein